MRPNPAVVKHEHSVGTLVAGVVPAIKSDAYHHGDLRSALIAVATDWLENRSPETLNLVFLARSLGVSKSAPYRHFADRDALLAAVAARGFVTFTALLAEGLHAGDESERLTRLGDAYISFALGHPGLYHLMFASHLLSHATEGDELKSAAQTSFNLLVSTIDPRRGEAWQSRRALRIWVGLHGVAMLATHGLLADGPVDVSLGDLVADIVNAEIEFSPA